MVVPVGRHRRGGGTTVLRGVVVVVVAVAVAAEEGGARVIRAMGVGVQAGTAGSGVDEDDERAACGMDEVAGWRGGAGLRSLWMASLSAFSL